MDKKEKLKGIDVFDSMGRILITIFTLYTTDIALQKLIITRKEEIALSMVGFFLIWWCLIPIIRKFR